MKTVFLVAKLLCLYIQKNTRDPQAEKTILTEKRRTRNKKDLYSALQKYSDSQNVVHECQAATGEYSDLPVLINNKK